MLDQCEKYPLGDCALPIGRPTPHWTVTLQDMHCKKGIVITTDSLLLQIQMSEHNHYYVEENYMTIFSTFLANFPPHSHTILAISCVHASNWFTHLQQTRQIDGQNDNSVLTVHPCHPQEQLLDPPSSRVRWA